MAATTLTNAVPDEFIVSTPFITSDLNLRFDKVYKASDLMKLTDKELKDITDAHGLKRPGNLRDPMKVIKLFRDLNEKGTTKNYRISWAQALNLDIDKSWQSDKILRFIKRHRANIDGSAISPSTTTLTSTNTTPTSANTASAATDITYNSTDTTIVGTDTTLLDIDTSSTLMPHQAAILPSTKQQNSGSTLQQHATLISPITPARSTTLSPGTGPSVPTIAARINASTAALKYPWKMEGVDMDRDYSNREQRLILNIPVSRPHEHANLRAGTQSASDFDVAAFVEKLKKSGNDTKDMIRALILERDQELTDRDRQIAVKDQQLADKDKEIAAKDQLLADKDQQIADIRQMRLMDLQRERTTAERSNVKLNEKINQQMATITAQQDKYDAMKTQLINNRLIPDDRGLEARQELNIAKELNEELARELEALRKKYGDATKESQVWKGAHDRVRDELNHAKTTPATTAIRYTPPTPAHGRVTVPASGGSARPSGRQSTAQNTFRPPLAEAGWEIHLPIGAPPALKHVPALMASLRTTLGGSYYHTLSPNSDLSERSVAEMAQGLDTVEKCQDSIHGLVSALVVLWEMCDTSREVFLNSIAHGVNVKRKEPQSNGLEFLGEWAPYDRDH